MARFEEALVRNYSRKYVCKKCKSVIRADAMKVISKEVKCRKCNAKKLRTPRKK